MTYEAAGFTLVDQSMSLNGRSTAICLHSSGLRADFLAGFCSQGLESVQVESLHDLDVECNNPFGNVFLDRILSCTTAGLASSTAKVTTILQRPRF